MSTGNTQEQQRRQQQLQQGSSNGGTNGRQRESSMGSLRADKPHCRQDQRGDGQRHTTRKSLVDRQSQSLLWATKAGTVTAAVAVGPDRISRREQEQQQQRQQQSHRRRASSSSALSSSSTSTPFFGSFDDSRYWDYAFRFTHKGDMGHHCRECKRPFSEMNEAIAVRRGGRIELRYHKACFSMIADPRSQPASSANVGNFVASLRGTVAPEEQYRKMRTGGHW